MHIDGHRCMRTGRRVRDGQSVTKRCDRMGRERGGLASGGRGHSFPPGLSRVFVQSFGMHGRCGPLAGNGPFREVVGRGATNQAQIYSSNTLKSG